MNVVVVVVRADGLGVRVCVAQERDGLGLLPSRRDGQIHLGEKRLSERTPATKK